MQAPTPNLNTLDRLAGDAIAKRALQHAYRVHNEIERGGIRAKFRSFGLFARRKIYPRFGTGNHAKHIMPNLIA